MSDTPTEPPLPFSIEPIEIQEEMERSFLDYAMSVIVSRALPDARDGLKPVHRRILWGMLDVGARPDRSWMKCARVTGEVMGKYHPHGDGAIYDALVRMAQDFSLRHPLVDGHGNFGSPDFGPAASRYCVSGDTRVRLADGSSVAIADLVDLPANSEADADFEVVDKDGKSVHVSKVFNSGVHPAKRLTTKLGLSLRGSHNHLVLCLVPVAGVPMFQWLRLDEITAGTVVCLAAGADADVLPSAPGDIPYVDAYVRSEVDADEVCALDPTMGGVAHTLWSRARGSGSIGRLEVLRVIAPILDSGYRFDEVVAVDDTEPAEVYSVRVDSDDHSFLAGGFVNHNTECRLAPIAMAMIDGIDENTVDFVDNYSGEFTEPIVLPSRFPNLLVNGSQGIAVGMATNIPPHNLGEVIDATAHLVDHPDSTPDDLMEFVKGPDFPTGALIMGRQGIMDAHRTGKGSIRMRAVAEIEEGTGRQRDRIVVTELPYQVGVNQVSARIKELVESRQIDGIADVNDESARGDTRLVIELKRDAPGLVVLNNLYKLTGLQTNFAVNTVALVDGVPRTLNLVQALQAYIDHQVDVIRRRSQFRLDEAERKLHIREGRLKAINVIDEVIALIRASDDRAAAKVGLMADPFEFTERQAEDILQMTLGQLTRLARIDLQKEIDDLHQTIAELRAILGDENRLRGVIKDELAELRQKYANERRSRITLDAGEFDLEDLIEDEELVVTLSAKGYTKTVSADTFRAQARGGKGVAGAKLRDDDYVTHILTTTAHAYLLFFSNLGRVYRLKAHEIPKKDRTARGTAIVNLLQLQPGEHIQAIIDTRDYETNRFLFFATKQGQVKKSKFNEYDSSLRTGLIAINLRDGDELVKVIPTNGGDDILMVSRLGQAIRFNEDDVRPMGRAAAGVRGMKLRSGRRGPNAVDSDEVVSLDTCRHDVAMLIVTDAGYGKRTQLEHFNRQGRGGQGVRGIKLTAKKGRVVAAFMVTLDDEIFVINSVGTVIRMPVREISSQGRDATGVRVMNVESGQTVAAVAPVLQADEV